MRKERMGLDGPRQEEELNAIADLQRLKLSDMSKFENLIVRWDSEHKRQEAVNREYFIGKFRKRQIVYKSLPDEVQKSVDAEVAKGQLQEYDDFVDVLKASPRAPSSGVCLRPNRYQPIFSQKNLSHHSTHMETGLRT